MLTMAHTSLTNMADSNISLTLSLTIWHGTFRTSKHNAIDSLSLSMSNKHFFFSDLAIGNSRHKSHGDGRYTKFLSPATETKKKCPIFTACVHYRAPSREFNEDIKYLAHFSDKSAYHLPFLFSLLSFHTQQTKQSSSSHQMPAVCLFLSSTRRWLKITHQSWKSSRAKVPDFH